ncbi:MAG: TIGR04438 family Trp-rich protein [Burkholderiaceae bacterium]
MWFVVLGVLLIAMKLADIGFVAAWSWWAVLSPFVAAAVWWAYADSSGLTKKREMDKLENKKLDRRRKNMEAMGIDRERQKTDDAAMRARRAAVQRVEGERSKKRDQNQQVIKDSVFDSRASSSFDEGDEAAPKTKL